MKAALHNSITRMFKNLEDIQTKLMSNPSDSSLWLQERALQHQLEKYILEQNLYWAQRVQQIWTQMGDKNTKFFQILATTRKRHNYICRIMDEHGIWLEDKNVILHIFFK